MENPPLRLLLGQDAYDLASAKVEALQEGMAQWKALTLSTGFAPATIA